MEALGGELLRQGAEGRVYAFSLFGRPCIVKERFAKRYRHPTLDERLTRSRLNCEARCITKAAAAGLRTPTLYGLDYTTGRVYMERIIGHTIRDRIADLQEKADTSSMRVLARDMGHCVAMLHNTGLVHGDLTTSNFMQEDESGDVVMIDFGLAYATLLPEDMAVDIYVLERAVESTHREAETLLDAFRGAYAAKANKSREVLAKLEEVRARGRKRVMVG